MTPRILLFLILAPQISWGQESIAIGTWRTHFSFRDAHTVAPTESGAYIAGSNSLFFLDRQDNSLNRLSKIDGLARSDISTISYHQSSTTLIIAYQNGTLDLLKEGEVVSIDDIANSPLSGSKNTNHIVAHGPLAYLATDFGVLVLDLEKAEVREAYTNIGPSGSSIGINYGAVFNDSLFLATADGVMAGSLDPAINLLDFANWRRYGSFDGIPASNASTIAAFNDNVYATIAGDGIYLYDGFRWNLLNFELPDEALAMTAHEDRLLITLRNQLLVMDTEQSIEVISDPLYPKPQFAVMDDNGLWIADRINGLVTTVSGALESIYPTGPFSDSIAFACYINGSMVLLPPGFNKFRQPLRTLLGISRFESGIWANYNSSGLPNTTAFPEIWDIVDVTFNPVDGKYYFASFGEGILQWSEDENFQILDENSPASTLINSAPGRNVKITNVLSSAEGLVWATNYGNPQPLHSYDPAESIWESFATPFLAARFPLDLQEATNGDLWMRLDPINGGGIWVINTQTGHQKLLTEINGEGGLPSRVVNDLVVDLQGQVWVGTDVGVVLYPFPFDILTRSEVNASTVFIDGRPLLRDEPVNCIAVDGGNRKWIGTDQGLWLFSELGDSVIYNFTEQNSPLPGNKIVDLAIDETSGEVFVVTDKGVVSYRGTATKGQSFHQQVRVFPNPVTRDFNGIVGISGLVNNATVKIADVTGKLISEIQAQGGTATWRVTDLQGRRVPNGVYLIYSSNADGSETYIGKIAVIN